MFGMSCGLMAPSCSRRDSGLGASHPAPPSAAAAATAMSATRGVVPPARPGCAWPGGSGEVASGELSESSSGPPGTSGMGDSVKCACGKMPCVYELLAGEQADK